MISAFTQRRLDADRSESALGIERCATIIVRCGRIAQCGGKQAKERSADQRQYDERDQHLEQRETRRARSSSERQAPPHVTYFPVVPEPAGTQCRLREDSGFPPRFRGEQRPRE